MASTALTLSGLGSYVNTLSSNSVSNKFWSELGTSLNSGDLTAAQSEYASYEKFASSTSNSTLRSDLSDLGTALQNGDLTAAESYYTSASKEQTNSKIADQISTAKSLAAQTASWITSMMNEDSSSSSSSIDPITALISSVYGRQSDSSYTEAVTALLKSKYAAMSGSSSFSFHSAATSSSILNSISTYA
jgi:hypothetical protein